MLHRFQHPLRSALLSCVFLLAATVLAEPITGKVVGVVDGDTVDVLVDLRPLRVRLNAIDAPERAQPFGNRARQRLASLCFGKTAEVNVNGHDRYGRAIGDVSCAGQSANEVMVSQGLAWVYRQYAPGDSALYALETEARAARRGLWLDDEPMAPWVWRKLKRQGRQGPVLTP